MLEKSEETTLEVVPEAKVEEISTDAALKAVALVETKATTENLPPKYLYPSLGMTLVFALVTYIIVRALLSRDKSSNSEINLDHLLMDLNPRTNKWEMSKPGAFGFASFCITSLIVIWMTFMGKMTEGLFGLYGTFWIAPTLVKLYKGDGTISLAEVKDFVKEAIASALDKVKAGSGGEINMQVNAGVPPPEERKPEAENVILGEDGKPKTQGT